MKTELITERHKLYIMPAEERMNCMERLKLLRRKYGYTQSKLGKEIGVNQNTISNWESGKRNADFPNLSKLAQLFKCTTDYLLGISDVEQPSKKGVRIPVLGYVKAGIPIDRIEEVVDYDEISEDMAKNGDFFGLKVKGDSMEPRIRAGDVVIVRMQPDISSGDIAIVCVGNDVVTIKEVLKNKSGIALIPFNHSYKVTNFTNSEIRSLPVTVIGKVVELRGKF